MQASPRNCNPLASWRGLSSRLSSLLSSLQGRATQKWQKSPSSSEGVRKALVCQEALYQGIGFSRAER